MKKVAIGCLIVIVVLGVVGGIGAFLLYRQVRSSVSQFSELGSVPAIEREVRNQRPFTPPESGRLTAGQVDRLVRVQTRVRGRLGQRFAELQEKYKELSNRKEATARDLPRLFAAYRDLATLWVEGKRAQVEALNEMDFSLAEYRWVRQRAYEAAGIPVIEIDVAGLIEDAKSGRTQEPPGTLSGSFGPGGPEENQKLIQPFKEQLEDAAALAMFGL